MWQIFLSSWRAGFRGRGFLAAIGLGVAVVAIAYLSSSFSPRQPRTVALDVGLSGLRFCLVLYAILIVQELVGREIDRRTVVLTLSYPIERSSYLLGRYFGVAGLSAAVTVVLALMLWLAVLVAGLDYDQPRAVSLGVSYWIAIAGIWVDVMVVAAFALWIASLSTVTMLPLTLGMLFAIAGRAFGAVADYLAHGADGQEELVNRFNPILEFIGWIMPDLSRLDFRIWTLYGTAPELNLVGWAVLAAIAYIVLLLGLAVSGFSRREFL